MFSVLTLKIFLIFFPGILGVKIIELLAKRNKGFSNTQWIINSFLLGIFSYLLMTSIPFVALDFKDIFSNVKDINISSKNLFAVTMISIIFSILIAYMIAQDTFHRVGRKYKLTNLDSQPTVISSIYNSSNDYYKDLQGSWVQIRRYEDDVSFIGELRDYDLTENNIEILLEDVTIYYDDKKSNYTQKSIYLNFVPNEIYIEYFED